jgi:hypothetical protein
MMQDTIRRAPIALAILALLAGVTAWSLSAAPAGASATFSPSLTPLSGVPAKISADKAAPFTLAQTSSKRATKIKPVNRRAERMTRAGAAPSSARSSSSGGGELARAKALLAAQIRKHPILKGTTVTFGNARGYQAIAYYASGRIVISRSHKASLSRIINHEIWHVIDYRDNGKIDWGERVPPR